MRHVWMLNHYALEPGRAGGTRHHSLARHLIRHGWKATILAASTLHPSGEQRLKDGELSRLETIDGVDFLWLRARSYSGNGLNRVQNMMDYTRRALQPALTRALAAPDVVIGSSVHPLAAWAGSRLARRHRVPFVFEVRDLWPQTLIDMGRLSPRHPVTVVLRRLEKSLYSRAARTISVLPGAADYIVARGIARERIVWISNGVDLADFGEPRLPLEQDGFTIMYLGAHGQANGLDTVLDAMRIVSTTPGASDIRLRLIGEGPLKPQLIDMAMASGLRNVTFENQVAKRDVPHLASQADAFVLSVRELPELYRYGISMNKLFDYMAAGRPVLIASNAANNPVSEAGAGIAVPPEDPQALADAMLRLSRTPREQRLAMGNAARRHVAENFSFAELSSRLAQVLDEVAGASAGIERPR